jgi:hypothetical protein
MIISASYKTDIPAFYGKWFMNRLRAGYCKMVNPYGRQVYRVDLAPAAVDGIVFWTKNIGPFLEHLPEVRERNYPFVVQHTINGYPRALESRVVAYKRAIQHMRQMSCDFGEHVAIWRYDPIIISSLTPIEWHLGRFATLAQELGGTTDEVVVSFAQIYQKTERNMTAAAEVHGFSWAEHRRLLDDPVDTTARDLALYMAGIAREHGMALRICSQQRFLAPGLVDEAHCVEAARLARVAKAWGLPQGNLCATGKQQGNRKECACAASRDVGEYDTCPHGCVYCYAVRNRPLALDRFKAHDPAGEFLFPPRDYVPARDDVPLKPFLAKPADGPHTRGSVRKPARGKALPVVQSSLFSE